MSKIALNISVDMANESWHRDELPWMPHLFSNANVLAQKLANSYSYPQPTWLSLHSRARTCVPRMGGTRHKKGPCFTLKT